VDRYEYEQGTVAIIGFTVETTAGNTLQITQAPTWKLTSRDGSRAASGTCTSYDVAAKQTPTAYMAIDTTAIPAGQYDLTATIHLIGSDNLTRTETPTCRVQISDRPPWP
jgi:hypothetical protein